MRKFFGVLTVLMLVFIAAVADDNKLMVYRSDYGFNVACLNEDFVMIHTLSPEGNYISFMGDRIPFEAIDSIVVRSSDIPTLQINLPDYPDAEQVWSKNDYVDATLYIRGNGMTDDATDLSLSIKGRGNSTWGFAKKPMRLKFDKKTSICGFEKAKSYILLANYIDPSLMHNAISYWLAHRLGVPYSNHTMPCNVWFNEKYVGSFLLTEKVGINSGSINDIAGEEGILLELSVEYDEKYKFKTAHYSLPVMVKDPDFDELFSANPSITPEERLELWEQDFNRAVANADFDEFDLESFVDYQLVTSFANNSEVGWPKSVFLHKANLNADTKYVFGPIWDHDATYDMRLPEEDGYKRRLPTADTWQNSLFARLIKRPEFQVAYEHRFEYFESEILPELLEFADDYARIIESSARLDGIRWPQENNLVWTYRIPAFYNRQIYAELRTYILERVEAMRAKLPMVL